VAGVRLRSGLRQFTGSGPTFGETAFACREVRVGWQGAWGSNPRRVVRLRGSLSMLRTPAAATARQPSPVTAFASDELERLACLAEAHPKGERRLAGRQGFEPR
jgi:hypothetical protein